MPPIEELDKMAKLTMPAIDPDLEHPSTVHELQCRANNEARPKTEQHTINTGRSKSFDELDKGEHNRVPLPGDEDYEGVVSKQMIEVG